MKKEAFREKYKKIRNNLSEERKKNGAILSFSFLQKKIKKYKSVLSFASKKNEIDVWNINKILEKEQRLYLTKIDKGNLLIYKVDDIEKDLILNKQFYLLEPNPKTCKEVFLDSIDLILVPGLAFDTDNHRLGYGKGYYDKLLSRKNVYTIGIGYKEQLSKKTFSLEHDVSLNEVALF